MRLVVAIYWIVWETIQISIEPTRVASAQNGPPSGSAALGAIEEKHLQRVRCKGVKLMGDRSDWKQWHWSDWFPMSPIGFPLVWPEKTSEGHKPMALVPLVSHRFHWFPFGFPSVQHLWSADVSCRAAAAGERGRRASVRRVGRRVRQPPDRADQGKSGVLWLCGIEGWRIRRSHSGASYCLSIYLPAPAPAPASKITSSKTNQKHNRTMNLQIVNEQRNMARGSINLTFQIPFLVFFSLPFIMEEIGHNKGPRQ